MAELTIVREPRTFEQVVSDAEPNADTARIRRLVEAAANANPHAASDRIVARGTPLLLPDNEMELCTDPALRMEMSQFALSPLEHRRVLDESLDIIGGEQLAALAALLADYDLYDASGDANTFGAAAIGRAVGRAAGLHGAIGELDKALIAFRDAPKHARRGAQQVVVGAYRKLNANFHAEIRQYVLRNKRIRRTRGHPLIHARRGLNMALGGSQRIPLSNHPTLRPVKLLMQHGRVLGRGMVVVDLGLRTRSVYGAYSSGENWNRALAGEIVSLGVSVVGAYVAAMLLGPFGIIIVLAAVGVAAVLGDHIGRRIGLGMYDSTARTYAPAFSR